MWDDMNLEGRLIKIRAAGCALEVRLWLLSREELKYRRMITWSVINLLAACSGHDNDEKEPQWICVYMKFDLEHCFSMSTESNISMPRTQIQPRFSFDRGSWSLTNYEAVSDFSVAFIFPGFFVRRMRFTPHARLQYNICLIYS